MDTNTDFLPDLAAPVKARKIRAPKHDFNNGEGKVFAHRHSNGNGWVADTASVAESVKVASGSSVWGCARVSDNVELTGKAQVGDYARVMQNARLSGTTVVRGAAVVRGTAVLTDKTFVCGTADISGNSFSQGRVHISDHVIIRGTRFNGPKCAYDLLVSGTAKVFDSTITGPSQLGNASIIQNAILAYVICANSCRIIDSSIHTSVDGDIAGFAYPSGRRRRVRAEPDPETIPPLAHNRLTCVYGTVIASNISMRPCVVTEYSYVLACHLGLWYQDVTTLFPEFPVGVIHGLSTNSLQELVAYYRRGANVDPRSSATSIPAIAAVGTVPSFDQVRQRRIMRIEENST